MHDLNPSPARVAPVGALGEDAGRDAGAGMWGILGLQPNLPPIGLRPRSYANHKTPAPPASYHP